MGLFCRGRNQAGFTRRRSVARRLQRRAGVAPKNTEFQNDFSLETESAEAKKAESGTFPLAKPIFSLCVLATLRETKLYY